MTKQDRNDTTTLSQYPFILCHFAKYALCLLCAEENCKSTGWVVLHGSKLHVDVHRDFE